jgi:hypothetical protein
MTSPRSPAGPPAGCPRTSSSGRRRAAAARPARSAHYRLARGQPAGTGRRVRHRDSAPRSMPRWPPRLMPRCPRGGQVTVLSADCTTSLGVVAGLQGGQRRVIVCGSTPTAARTSALECPVLLRSTPSRLHLSRGSPEVTQQSLPQPARAHADLDGRALIGTEPASAAHQPALATLSPLWHRAAGSRLVMRLFG